MEKKESEGWKRPFVSRKKAEGMVRILLSWRNMIPSPESATPAGII